MSEHTDAVGVHRPDIVHPGMAPGAHAKLPRSTSSSRDMDEDINTLRRILRDHKTVAVVGLSANWWRPSFFAAKYLQERGYRIVPVNPQYPEILGEKSYAKLRDI